MNISSTGGDQDRFNGGTAPASGAIRITWADGPDPLPIGRRNHVWVSSGPCLEIPITSTAGLLFESTRRFGTTLNTTARQLVSVLRTGFFITQDNRLARYVLSTRH